MSFSVSKKFILYKDIEKQLMEKNNIEIVNYIMYHTKLQTLAIIKDINNRESLNLL